MNISKAEINGIPFWAIVTDDAVYFQRTIPMLATHDQLSQMEILVCKLCEALYAAEDGGKK